MKKFIGTAILLLSLLLTACTAKNMTAEKNTEAAETEAVISLKEDQTLIFGQVTAINGNEVVLAMAEEGAESDMGSGAITEMPSRPFGEMPSGADGERPSRPFGEMPSGADGEMPDRPFGKMPGRSSYTLTGEEKTFLIPVGTTVTTPLGTETTFSNIAAGDMLKLVTETNEKGEETIIAIWIVEVS